MGCILAFCCVWTSKLWSRLTENGGHAMLCVSEIQGSPEVSIGFCQCFYDYSTALKKGHI